MNRSVRSRRSFLQLVAGFALGATALAVSGGLLNADSLVQNFEGLGSFANLVENSRASLITVKVYYSMMAEYTQLDEEDFVLQGSATVRDLLRTVVVRHPSMAEMVQTMQVLVNGVAATQTSILHDADVVQFIPFSAGG